VKKYFSSRCKCISVNLGSSTIFSSEDDRIILLLGHVSGWIRRLFHQHMVWYNLKFAPEGINCRSRLTEKCVASAECISVNLGSSTIFTSEDDRTVLLLGHVSGWIRRLFHQHMVWYNIECAPEGVNSQSRHTEKCKWLLIEFQFTLNRSWKLISSQHEGKKRSPSHHKSVVSAETEATQLINVVIHFLQWSEWIIQNEF
jgi:hypothetical protein